jgi:hypothetical protein
MSSMAKEQQYQALSGTDEDGDQEKAFVPGKDHSRIKSSRPAFAVCVAALLISLAVNVLLTIDNTRLRTTSRDNGKTKYSKAPSRV